MNRPNLSSTPQDNLRPVIATGVLLTLLSVFLVLISAMEFVNVKGEERALQERLEKIDSRRAELAGQVSELSARLRAVQWKKLDSEASSMGEVVLTRRLMWSELLADLERVLPRDVRLVSISPSATKDGDVAINLIGVASSRDAWLQLISVLFADPRFAKPEPLSEAGPSQGAAMGTQFNLRVLYRPGASA